MSWNYQNKNTGTYDYLDKEDVIVYFVSYAGDYYLVGQNENEFLIATGGGYYNYVNKS